MFHILDAMTLGRHDPIEAYLDLRDGGVEHVIADPLYLEDSDVPSVVDAGPERYARMETVETRRQYRWMADWTSTVDEPDIREMLEIALDGKGAFGRFRDVLSRYPDLEDDWREARQKILLGLAIDWLRDELDIEPEYELPAPKPSRAPNEPQNPVRPNVELLDMLLLGDPDRQSTPVSGSVRRRLPVRSKTDGRRIFKVLAREVCEWNGVAWRKRFIQGKTSLDMGRFHLSLHKDAIELSVDVPREVWDSFA
jgi:hypothetical protein